MARYSKLIVAVIGLVAIIAGPEVLNLTDQTEVVSESLIALATAFGVYQIPNAGTGRE